MDLKEQMDDTERLIAALERNFPGVQIKRIRISESDKLVKEETDNGPKRAD